MFKTLLDRLDERQLRMVVAGAFVLLGAVLFTYVLLPSTKEYRQQLATVQVLEQSAIKDQNVSETLTRIAAEVEALNRELNGDMANLPENELESFVVGRLQTISWRNDVELQSVQPRAGESIQSFTESLFEVELSGSYLDLFSWLGAIKEQLGFIVIKDYKMRPVEDVTTNPRLVVQLTIASYRVSRS